MSYIDELAPQTYISRRFYESVKLSGRKAHELAAASGLDSSTMSLAINRKRKVRLNDPRFIELGRILGLEKTKLFEPIKKRRSHGKRRAA